MRHFVSRMMMVIFVSLAAGNVLASSSPEIIPHRGGRAENPENTLPAFKTCLALGAKTLELDVQISRDNVAVVYHPSDLSANTNGKGAINQYTVEELKQFDAAYTFNPKEGYPLRGKATQFLPLKKLLIALLI